MAKSAELKRLIVEKIKSEWNDPDVGDWKNDDVPHTDELYRRMTDTKNWKRFYKEKVKMDTDTFVMRQFSFQRGEEDVVVATVTCDENDNFLEEGIEFECS